MGTKYTSQSAIGYNSAPPPDDGTQVEANRVKYSTIKTKLGDPTKTLADNINTQLVTALDTSSRSVGSSDTAVAGDHLRTIEVTTASVIITLSDAATMTSGYIVRIANQSSGTITVARATGGDTIDGTAANITLQAKSSRTFLVKAAANGYISLSTADFNNLVLAGSLAATGGSAPGVSVAAVQAWVSGSSALVDWIDSSQSANSRIFSATYNSGVWKLRRMNDAYNVETLLLTVDPSGPISLALGQLKFPATQNPSADANTLDDYEEGTWTPTVGGTSTYTFQSGEYTKIGRLVFAYINFTINAIGTGSATTVSGLPFTASGQTYTLAVNTWTSLAVNPVFLAGRTNSNATTITMQGVTAAGATTGTLSVFQNSANVIMGGSYHI